MRDGKYEGPLSREKVEEMLNAGQLKRSDLAFRDGLSNWMPVVAALSARTAPPAHVPAVNHENSTAISTANGTAHPPVPSPNPTAAQPSKPVDFLAMRYTNAPVASSLWNGFKSADWSVIFPLSELRREQPWNFVWVRWLLLFTLSLPVFGYWSSVANWSAAQDLLAFGAYWGTAWAFGMHFVVKPEKVHALRAVLAASGCLFLWCLLTAAASRMSSVKPFFEGAGHPDLAKRLLPQLTLSTITLATLLCPTLLVSRWSLPTTPRSILYLGVLLGLIFGARTPLLSMLNGVSPTIGGWLPQPDILAPMRLMQEQVCFSLFIAVLAHFLWVIINRPVDRTPLLIVFAVGATALLTLLGKSPSSLVGCLAMALVTLLFACSVLRTAQPAMKQRGSNGSA